MKRQVFFGGLSALLVLTLLPAPRAGAQFNSPPNVPKLPFPKIEGFPPELQREFDRAFEQNQKMFQLQQQILQQAFGKGRVKNNNASLKWGGLRLKKADAALQEKLGLPENEGMVVGGVDLNSAGSKAGLKEDDILVKINDKPVPSDLQEFAKMVKDRKPNEPVEMVVVRKGKEEVIKGVRMPADVQNSARPFGRGAAEFVFPRIDVNPDPRMIPNPQGKIENLQLEMIVDGAKIVRKQTADTFFGEYSRGDLKMTVKGQIANGPPRIEEIIVQEGKETKKYANLAEVPLQRRMTIQRMLLPSNNAISAIPLQFLPFFPGLDD